MGSLPAACRDSVQKRAKTSARCRSSRRPAAVWPGGASPGPALGIRPPREHALELVLKAGVAVNPSCIASSVARCRRERRNLDVGGALPGRQVVFTRYCRRTDRQDHAQRWTTRLRLPGVHPERSTVQFEMAAPARYRPTINSSCAVDPGTADSASPSDRSIFPLQKRAIICSSLIQVGSSEDRRPLQVPDPM